MSSDYKQSTKHKCLIKTADPNQFPDYPQYMQPPEKKMRISLAVEKWNSFHTEHQPYIFTDIDTTIDNHEVQTLDFGTNPVSMWQQHSSQHNICWKKDTVELFEAKSEKKEWQDSTTPRAA